MSLFFDPLFRLLTEPPGNLAYYVILAFTVIGALQSSMNHWRRSGFPQGNRMVAGLALLLIMQLLQFALGGLAWLGLISSQTWLPPVDRLVLLVNLVLVVWLWLVPEPVRLADAAFFMVAVLVGTFSVFSLVWWSEQTGQIAFNAAWPDWGASLFAMLIIGMGWLGLLIRRPNGWGIGSAMLALLFAGHLSQFVFPQVSTNFSGVIRLSQLMAFPWLFALPQRFPIIAGSSPLSPKSAIAERRRFSSDPKAVQDLMDLVSQPTDAYFGVQVGRIISQLMLSDFCMLVTPPDDNHTLVVSGGYNLIEERPIEGFVIDARLAPMLASAIQRGKPLRLPSSSTSPDLQVLAQGLRLPRVGHMMAAPISLNNAAPIMGLVLLSPYSNRGWSLEDQNVLTKYANFLAYVLSRSQTGEDSLTHLARLNQELHDAEEAKQRILEQLESVQGEAVAQRRRAEELAALIAGHETETVETQESQGEPLLDEPVEAQVSRAAFEEIQADLRLALEQIAVLRDDLTEAERHHAVAVFSQLESTAQEDKIPGDSPEMAEVVSVIQDLRQPMSSILGYTDLLLGESVGILGALQRKFLERIRASVERLGGLTDDLIQMVALEESNLKLNPEMLHVDHVIEAAIAEAMECLHEKNILLKKEIAASLPPLRADRNALEQVLIHLLQNAGERTPAEGEVNIVARAESKEHEPGYILIQVSDSGGGIPPHELPRVFSRLYPAGSLFSDLGDTLAPFSDRIQPAGPDMDLSTVKALVEAHGGRIWVDSTLGKGSTFSTLLPLVDEPESG